MRRILPAVLAAVVMATGLVACSGESVPEQETDQPASSARGTEPSREDLALRVARIADDLDTACLAPEPTGSAEAPASAGPPTARSSAASQRQEFPWLDPADGATALEALTAAARGTEEDLGVPVSIALHSRDENTTTAVGALRSYPSASLSKVPVAVAYLRQQRELGIELTDADRRMLEEAIVHSDNEAAAQTYLRLGGADGQRRDALQEILDLLGAEEGVVSDLPGLNPTSVQDQLLVLEALQSPPPWLHERDAALIRTLMAVPGADGHRIDDSQAFGMGSLAQPGRASLAQEVHVKNGWIGDRTDGSGFWSAGTAGFGSIDGADYDLVIMLDGAPNSDCAFTVLDAISEVSARSAGR